MRMLEQDPTTRYADLVGRHRHALNGLAYRIIGDVGAAEEVVQDSFAKLATHAVVQRPDNEIAAWLRRVTCNAAFNRLRSQRRETQRVLRLAALRPVVSGTEGPLDEVVAAEEREHVRAVLAELPERQRAVLVLRSAGCSYAEIAATVEIAVGSVGVLLARGERAFRRAFTQSATDLGQTDLGQTDLGQTDLGQTDLAQTHSSGTAGEHR